MTTKVVKKLKYALSLLFIASAIISCEKDIEDIGVSLIDNNLFDYSSTFSNVIVANENIEKTESYIDTRTSNKIVRHLLGVYNDTEFGQLKASIAAQITIPNTGDYYVNLFQNSIDDLESNTIIDSVLITIPYTTQFDSILEVDGGSDELIYNSDIITGNKTDKFKLEVFELGTFFNSLDPNDPSQPAVYQTNKVYQKETLLFSDNFQLNENDTIFEIKRYLSDGVTVYETQVIDSVTKNDSSRFLKIPLDKELIKSIFIDNAENTTNFDSFENFSRYFRGFYFEATPINNNSHLISLNLENAKMSIYYSYDEKEAEGEDLDGDETTGESLVRTKHVSDFTFTSFATNVYERDYTNSKASGTDKIYIQGASGEEATVELFTDNDLANFQEQNLLITEANLTFYVDQSADNNIVPSKLLIYNYDDKEHIIDMYTEGSDLVGGNLEYDDNGEPLKYVFRITDYVSELLKDSEYEQIKFGIKVYNTSTDTPSSYGEIVKDYSWSPKGVVLYGSDESAGDNRVKLEIKYTELN
ncbi:DUF4270 family protein [Lutibacter sp. TH_r2]|uniref:DUF4270 family protein n=1 Tax=Lutibacter sp. TH_r2 TaxID=3082083 RepID=UPI002955C8E1|nr:DUF4270 family protein [Lutibacter sp. TH_r2]MDV7186673.1 DUF4270 family protein [Lutibacter sp. TH_r2]